MKIALGADHAGFELKEKIKEYLLKKGGIEVIDKGTNSKESVDYPKYGHAVANAVVSKEVDFGILTNLVIAPVLTASGGETIPPSKIWPESGTSENSEAILPAVALSANAIFKPRLTSRRTQSTTFLVGI